MKITHRNTTYKYIIKNNKFKTYLRESLIPQLKSLGYVWELGLYVGLD